MEAMIFPLRRAVRLAAQDAVVQIAAVAINFTKEILLSRGSQGFFGERHVFCLG
jgi:hypothetical protein